MAGPSLVWQSPQFFSWTTFEHHLRSLAVLSKGQFRGINLLGPAKGTLCGIAFFKLNTFFSHVFAGP